MSDVSSGISGLSFDSSFRSHLFFCLILLLLPFSVFHYELGFFVWFLVSSWEMIVGRWYVQLALLFPIMHLYIYLKTFLKIVSANIVSLFCMCMHVYLS